MGDLPPYMNGYGYITTVLDKIKSAPTPPRFTNDFLYTKLGVTSNSARPVVSFLKRIGFLDQGGTPSERYKEFRNASYSGSAAAAGLKQGFASLYASNEYAHDLGPSDLEGLVLQVTGLDRSNQTVKAIIGSFNALKAFADFDGAVRQGKAVATELAEEEVPKVNHRLPLQDSISPKLNLAYTINLTLPETTNIEVFDAIFQSLNRNILKPNE
jgi:hypothetical protein